MLLKTARGQLINISRTYNQKQMSITLQAGED